ncbi:MAG: carbohydrate-binding family 9-like protein [Verrucomicrobia bacterium]|nr:carbohydrate-binding family 9-like protein [Verrucomicrobiota bacterium]
MLGLVRLTEPLRVDGWLNEPIYERLPPVTDFKVASRPGATAPATKAWLQWDECGLWFAFAAHDTSLVTTPATSNEHEVDAQDRVELFLWPESSGRYFCVEFAPSGAVHDYAARVYRQFDDSWRPAGATFAARRTAEGYAVEGFMPVAVLREMGVCSWQAGARFHLGLYRADFRPEAPDDPVWLTWIEPNLPQPDFHVRATFALVELAP